MKKRIVVIILLIALGSATYWYLNRPIAPVNGNLTLYGNIDIRQVQLSFHDPEHIAEMKVEEGDKVKKGQLLAVQDLERFNSNLQAAQARLQAQQQQVAKLDAGTRKEDLAKAWADVEAVIATVKFAKIELKREQTLVKKSLTSKESVDRAQASLDEAKAKLNAVRAQYALLKKGPRIEDIAAAKALLDADKVAVSLAEQKIEDAHLYAPSNGIIRDRVLEPGDMADGHSAVYTLALVDPVWARTYVPETELGKLHHGQQAFIHTDSHPEKSYQGWIGYISPTAEFTPKAIETPELRTSLVYQMRVFACNPDDELRLGMPVTVTITPNDKNDAQTDLSCKQ